SSLLFFSSRRRHTRSKRDWSSDVCSSDLSFVLLSFEVLSLLVSLLLLSSLSSSFESSLESFDSFVFSVCSVLLSSVFWLFVVSSLLLHAAKVRDYVSHNVVTMILLLCLLYVTKLQCYYLCY